MCCAVEPELCTDGAGPREDPSIIPKRGLIDADVASALQPCAHSVEKERERERNIISFSSLSFFPKSVGGCVVDVSRV